MTRTLRRILHWGAAMALMTVSSAAERPNIVFILADDLGYRELGCYGQEKKALKPEGQASGKT